MNFINTKTLRDALFFIFFIIFEIFCQSPSISPKRKFIYQELLNSFEETASLTDFELLLTDILPRMKTETNCLAMFLDSYYDTLVQPSFHVKFNFIPNFKIFVNDSEDLLSPGNETLSVIERIRKEGCSAYVFLIANAIQVGRLLRFGDKHRMIDTRAKFLLQHDRRLFHQDYHYLWKKIVNVIFIRRYIDSDRYELSTVPFPAPIKGTLVPKRIDTWRKGKFQTNLDLFRDKTSDLQGQILKIVTFEHIPAVAKSVTPASNDSRLEQTDFITSYYGLEIEVLQALAAAMNFHPNLYEPVNSSTELWGRAQPNGSFSGLLGEVSSGRADIALGNLYYTPYHLQILDLSTPYTTQCLTFLTPESLSDNSWKTLVSSFQRSMWIAVMLILFLGGFLFYGLANFHRYLEKKDYSKVTENKKNEKESNLNNMYNKSKGQVKLSFQWVRKLFVDQKKREMEKRLLQSTKNIYYNFDKPSTVQRQSQPKISVKKSKKSKRLIEPLPPKTQGLYLFESLQNSILYTFGMLVLVSLPKIPTGWALRILSGWWWIYCLLVAVSYRASLTAILANPVPRVTIDTLEQLADDTSVACGGWGEQNRDFFYPRWTKSARKLAKSLKMSPTLLMLLIELLKAGLHTMKTFTTFSI